jgi:hypothetical protein
MRARGQSGGVLLEAAMFLPIVLALLVGTVNLAEITYTFHSLQKVMFSLARYVGTQQGVNFCDPMDPGIVAAKNFALTGTTDSAENPSVVGLTPDMLEVRIERYDPVSQQLTVCDCSVTGCDASQGGLPPDFIVVSLTNGYTVRPMFWGFTPDPFQLRPQVRVPYGGT